MTDQQFTIRDFIDNRWRDARIKLSSIDPEFVQRIDMIESSQRVGLVIPGLDALPDPSHRLPDIWHGLLATSMDVVEELERLHFTVSLMDPDGHHEIDRRLDVYYFGVWLQDVYNFCEKVDKLATKSCRVLLRPHRSIDWGTRQIYYRRQIKAQVRDQIDQLRSPAVHGSGGRGTLPQRVITDQHQGWEVMVAGGPRMIDEVLEAFGRSEGDLPPRRFFSVLTDKTEYVVVTLGAILHDLDREILDADAD